MTSPANAGTAKPRSTTEDGSGTADVTVALIDDTPPLVGGALRLRRPGRLVSAETIVKSNPSRFCDSGELNCTNALLLVDEIAPDIVPLKVIESDVAVFVTTKVKVSLTVTGVLEFDDVVNVPRLTFAGGVVGIVGNADVYATMVVPSALVNVDVPDEKNVSVARKVIEPACELVAQRSAPHSAAPKIQVFLRPMTSCLLKLNRTVEIRCPAASFGETQASNRNLSNQTSAPLVPQSLATCRRHHITSRYLFYGKNNRRCCLFATLSEFLLRFGAPFV
jgi:hypothetical protein